MTVCRFFLQGYCRYGENCRNEHPSGHGKSQNGAGPGLFGRVTRDQDRNQTSGVFARKPENQQVSRQTQNSNQGSFARHSGNQNQNQTRDLFARSNQGQNDNRAPNQSQNLFARNPQGRQDNRQNNRGGHNQNNQRNQSGRSFGGSTLELSAYSADNFEGYQNDSRSYGVTRDVIMTDLELERPQWLASAYGPGNDAPVQIMGGYPLEQSPEEVRAAHYLAISQGNPQAGIDNERMLAMLSNNQVKEILQDVNESLKYLENGAKTHPNRLDMSDSQKDFLALVGLAFFDNVWKDKPSQFGANFKYEAANAPAFLQPQAQPANQNQFGTPQNPANHGFPPAFQHQKQDSINMAENQPQSFAQPAGFAQIQPTTSLFSVQQPQQQPMTNGASPPSPSVFQAGQPNSASPGANMTPEISSYAAFANGHLTSWKGKQVTQIDGVPCYRRDDGQWERIWFPQGQPQNPTATDVPAEMYTEEVKNGYGFVANKGAFLNGNMPEVPPKPEWTRFDV